MCGGSTRCVSPGRHAASGTQGNLSFNPQLMLEHACCSCSRVVAAPDLVLLPALCLPARSGLLAFTSTSTLTTSSGAAATHAPPLLPPARTLLSPTHTPGIPACAALYCTRCPPASPVTRRHNEQRPPMARTPPLPAWKPADDEHEDGAQELLNLPAQQVRSTDAGCAGRLRAVLCKQWWW